MDRESLNQKAWYRGLKLLFILFFIISQIVGAFVVYILTSDNWTYYLPIKDGEYIAVIRQDGETFSTELDSYLKVHRYPTVRFSKKLTDEEADAEVMKWYPSDVSNVPQNYQIHGYEDFKKLTSDAHFDKTFPGGRDNIQSFLNYFASGVELRENPLILPSYPAKIKVALFAGVFLGVCFLFWFISRSFFYVFAKEKFIGSLWLPRKTR